MINNRLGKYIPYQIADDKYKAFIPSKLPPVPAIDMSSLLKLLEQANRELGALNNLANFIPNSEKLIS